MSRERIFKFEPVIRDYGTFSGMVDHYVWVEMEKVGATLDDGLRETTHFGGGGNNKLQDGASIIAELLGADDNCVIVYDPRISKHSRELFSEAFADSVRHRRGLDSTK